MAHGDGQRGQRQVERRSAPKIGVQRHGELLELAPPPPDTPARGALLDLHTVRAVVAARLGVRHAHARGALVLGRRLSRLLPKPRQRAQQPHLARDHKPLGRVSLEGGEPSVEQRRKIGHGDLDADVGRIRLAARHRLLR